ncbi:MAG: response regulator [Defluviitaleaceae bacterium]|nr:response regulator [Defluviitaleaceae bacterium]
MAKTIFVIDDIHTNLYTAEQALGDLYNVITIPSGKKALSILQKIRPQLILLDIDMPEMDGFEVLEHLKSSQEYRDIPVIFLTGAIEPQTEARGYEMGVVDFITKPFSNESLLSRIKPYVE